MDDGNLIGTVFLDHKKAFDMVDHKHLCKKLQYYKISTNSMKWFESYLSLRKHNLCIGSNISNPEPVKYGVPQGFILGSLLFNIFINDLPLENLTSDIDMYADDTTLSINGKNIFEIEAILNEDLNSVNMWCTNNNMVINPTKTTCMLIGTKQRKAMMEKEFNIYISNENIQNVNIQKLLGIYLDWKNQIDYICKNISSRLFLFAKIKQYLDQKCNILFFNSYILPIFDFCCIVWGNCSEEGIQRITKLQKRAARIILDAPFFTPTQQLFDSLNWLPFREKNSYHKLILAYTILNNKAPDYHKKLCIPSSESHSRNLRSDSNNNLSVIRPKTNVMKKSFA
jgi:hypothetical protein